MKTKLVIFGITGDLAKRKLLPALRKILEKGALTDISIIGVSRQMIDIEDIVGEQLAPISTSTTLDLSDPAQYQGLKNHINLQDDEQLVVYLAVPPLAATEITDNLGAVGLNTTNVKILFEKPFGVNLESAREMVLHVNKFFEENQVYRIDHYLAKEMAQNIVAFRSGNAMLKNIWNHQSIDHIEIVATEEVGVEGRAHFYEQVGALRDVLQGHLMQLLSLILMDTPSNLDWQQLPDLRYQALSRLEPANPNNAVRAQYDTYKQEVNNPSSLVETFVSVELHSNSGTWEGVPIRITTGKALSRKNTEVIVHFRAANHEQSNCLRFKIQPDEGIEIDLYAKKPGYDRVFEAQKLEFKYPEDTLLPEAYEQVLVDAVRSHKSLFTSSAEIIESWRVLQPLLDDWNKNNAPLPTYARGSDYNQLLAL